MQTRDSKTVSSVAQSPSGSLRPLGPQNCGLQQYHFDMLVLNACNLCTVHGTHSLLSFFLSFFFLSFPFLHKLGIQKLLLSECI